MVKVGDKINPPGTFDLPLRVMQIVGDNVITVHWQEWSVLKSDDLDRYATVHSSKIKDLEP